MTILQDLKEGYLNSSTKTIDRAVSQMHETCKNGDTVMEDDTGLLHFSRAIEDDQPNIEENEAGRGKTTWERSSLNIVISLCPMSIMFLFLLLICTCFGSDTSDFSMSELCTVMFMSENTDTFFSPV